MEWRASERMRTSLPLSQQAAAEPLRGAHRPEQHPALVHLLLRGGVAGVGFEGVLEPLAKGTDLIRERRVEEERQEESCG